MINWFEKYYEELTSFASALVYGKKLLCDPIDLVNDAYIKFIESGEEFSLKKVKNIIYSSHFAEVQETADKRAIGERETAKEGGLKQYSRRILSPKGDRVCAGCNEIVPVNGYYLTKSLKGALYLHLECKACALKRKKKWFAENRGHWNAYVRSRWNHKVDPIKGNRGTLEEQTARALEKYREKTVVQMSDVYIKKLLQCKYKNQHIPQEAIEAKRKELLEKRNSPATKLTNKERAKISYERRKKDNPFFLKEQAAKKQELYKKRRLKAA